MAGLSTTVERFRLVKDAYHDFLTRWALDRGLNRQDVAEHLFEDITSATTAVAGPIAGPNAGENIQTFSTSSLHRAGLFDDE